MTTEIAKLRDGEIVVADPFETDKFYDADDVISMVVSVRNRAILRANEFAALGEIEDAPIDAVRELHKAIESDDAVLKAFDKNIKDALLELSGFKGLIVQIKGKGARIDELSVRGKLAEIDAQLKARIDAEKVKVPPSTFIIEVTCTDDEFESIAKAAEKKVGRENVRWAKATTDAAFVAVKDAIKKGEK